MHLRATLLFCLLGLAVAVSLAGCAKREEVAIPKDPGADQKQPAAKP